jgi:hypothetical protein
VPIILLSFVNLLVFCIPVASGERGSLAFWKLSGCLCFNLFSHFSHRFICIGNHISVVLLLLFSLCNWLTRFLVFVQVITYFAIIQSRNDL